MLTDWNFIFPNTQITIAIYCILLPPITEIEVWSILSALLVASGINATALVSRANPGCSASMHDQVSPPQDFLCCVSTTLHGM
jgi:hypothetical protein